MAKAGSDSDAGSDSESDAGSDPDPGSDTDSVSNAGPAHGSDGELSDGWADAVYDDTLSRWVRASQYAISLIRQLVHQWVRDRCPQQAASLAFQTVLSVVPLTAVAMAALRLWGDVGAESTLVAFLSEEFIPVSREVIATQLTEWSTNISMRSLGIMGLCTTVLLAFILVNNLEKTINAIWRSDRKRPLAQKFVVFYATVTLGPLLMGASLYEATQAGLTEGSGRFLIGVSTSFGALFFANYFLPVKRARMRAAMAGALVSTVLLELAKYAFKVYVTNFAFGSMSGIYGALAVIPLWLLWVYYGWLVFLLGVEVAYATQNLGFLQRRDRRGPMSLENEIVRRVNGVLASRIMMAIAAAYINGQKVTSRTTLEDIFDLSGEVLDRIAARLKGHDLILEVEGEFSGYLPARPPSEISLSQVLSAFRNDDISQAAHNPRTRLDQILAQLDEDARSRTEDLYFDQLV